MTARSGLTRRLHRSLQRADVDVGEEARDDDDDRAGSDDRGRHDRDAGVAFCARWRARWKADWRMSRARSTSASVSGTPSSSACWTAVTKVPMPTECCAGAARRRPRAAGRRVRSGAARAASPRAAGLAGLGHAPQRRTEGDARAHAHREDVQEVGEPALDGLLAAPGRAMQPRVEPERAEEEQRQRGQPAARQQREQRQADADHEERALAPRVALDGEPAGAPRGVDALAHVLAPGRVVELDALDQRLARGPEAALSGRRGDSGARA